MGLGRESGTLEPGKRADLVLLDADPLDAIPNVRRVSAVITAGRMYRPAPLWRASGFTP
jgi:imidazolonepropionase-like amidohydrolase